MQVEASANGTRPKMLPAESKALVQGERRRPEWAGSIIPYCHKDWAIENMKTAVSHAEKCPMSDRCYSIGCIIVIDNEIVSSAHSREHHEVSSAVESALNKLQSKMTKMPPNYFFRSVVIALGRRR